MTTQPGLKYELEFYRKFISEASPYVSLVIGRKITADEAQNLSLEELTEIAHLIDERAQSLARWNKHSDSSSN